MAVRSLVTTRMVASDAAVARDGEAAGCPAERRDTMNATTKSADTKTGDFGWLTSRRGILDHVTGVLTHARNGAAAERADGLFDDNSVELVDMSSEEHSWLGEELADVNACCRRLLNAIDRKADVDLVREAMRDRTRGPKVVLPSDGPGQVALIERVIAAQQDVALAARVLYQSVSEAVWSGGSGMQDLPYIEVLERTMWEQAAEEELLHELKLCAVALMLAQRLPPTDAELAQLPQLE
ncbi:MAG: hypothetical protein HY905_03915 [Deltaproteobacteria bacterium]|nr:hypothetical protein [Deltaproteobacteria bacterium]